MDKKIINIKQIRRRKELIREFIRIENKSFELIGNDNNSNEVTTLMTEQENIFQEILDYMY